jgi:tagaturonate reductase
MILPCTHAAIILTDSLQDFERLKLWLLNLGHTYLAERWLAGLLHPQATVREAMLDAQSRAELEAVWNDEVLPVFEVFGQRAAALDYLLELRERLLNPFLAHRLADIAQHHAQKKQRRMAPVLELARQHGLRNPQARLHAALASSLSA